MTRQVTVLGAELSFRTDFFKRHFIISFRHTGSLERSATIASLISIQLGHHYTGTLVDVGIIKSQKRYHVFTNLHSRHKLVHLLRHNRNRIIN